MAVEPATPFRPGRPRDRASDAGPGGRLGRAERYDVLVDAAATLVAEGDVDAVSMEAVAARAGVSRPLVYKHFANRHELLAAVYRREAVSLDAGVVAAVGAVEGFETIVRTMIHGILSGARARGDTFVRLQRAGARDATLRREQRNRDRRTVRYFTRLAADEYGVAEADARVAVRVLLSGIDSLLAQRHRHPEPEHQQRLEDVYVSLVLGGLERLAQDGRRARG